MSIQAPFVRPSALSYQHWFAAALALLVVALSVQYTLKARSSRSAFERWRPQIIDLFRGVDAYQTYEYPNPPIMAVILRPFTALPTPFGSLAWFYAKVGMTLLAMWWAFRLVAAAGPPFPGWAKVLTVILSLKPIAEDLSHGNVNLFIMFLVMGALVLRQSGRRFLGGIVLGLAVACKVTPALFVPYFVWKRCWMSLAGCATGLVLFLGLVPGCVFTFERNNELLTHWTQQMIVPFVAKNEVTSEHQNQSLPGLVYRLTTASPSFLRYEGGTPVPAAYHNVLGLPRASAGLIVKGLMAAFALLVCWTCSTPTSPPKREPDGAGEGGGGWRPAAEFGLVLIGMLLFSERTWKHHCVTLLLPFAVVVYCLAVRPMAASIRWYLSASLVAVLLLMYSTGSSAEPGGPEMARLSHKLAEVYGAYTWACLLLVGCLATLLRLPHRAPSGSAVRGPGPTTLGVSEARS